MIESHVPKGQTAMSSMAGEITKKAYDKETFSSLLECCTRLFFCDEEIVIIDLLLAMERAISEKDLEDELGMAEHRLREHLARLEKHGILTRYSTTPSANIFQKPLRAYKKDLVKESFTPQSIWRINTNVILAIHYKLSKMEEVLQQRLKGLYESDKFVCPKCQATYDALTVQTLEMDGFDAHFICKCGTKVELDDKTTKEDIYSSQQRRFEEQVKTLKKCLFEAWGMDVPEFPLLVKKIDKTLIETESKADSASAVGDNNSVTGGSSVASGASEGVPKSVARSVAASDPGIVESRFGGRTDNRKIKFHMKVGAKDVQKLPSSEKVRQSITKEPSKEQEVEMSQTTQEEPGKVELDEGCLDEIPDFYISKLGKTVSLMEAQEYQQHMTNLEFEVGDTGWGNRACLELRGTSRQIFKFHLICFA